MKQALNFIAASCAAERAIRRASNTLTFACQGRSVRGVIRRMSLTFPGRGHPAAPDISREARS